MGGSHVVTSLPPTQAGTAPSPRAHTGTRGRRWEVGGRRVGGTTAPKYCVEQLKRLQKGAVSFQPNY